MFGGALEAGIRLMMLAMPELKIANRHPTMVFMDDAGSNA